MARLQREDFDVGKEIRHLVKQYASTGGTVAFLGTARDISRGERIVKLEFEHYPGMAEKELNKLEIEAKERFEILDAIIIHRVGEIPAGDNIVLIVVTSAHRAAAFDACEWLIDELKKRVPIWKKEFAASGAHWVEDHP